MAGPGWSKTRRAQSVALEKRRSGKICHIGVGWPRPGQDPETEGRRIEMANIVRRGKIRAKMAVKQEDQ